LKKEKPRLPGPVQLPEGAARRGPHYGDSYKEYLKKLGKEMGIEEPTQEDLSKLDRKRKKNRSNANWEHPQDPDAHITKMKNGSTHMAHKSEHGVDLGSCAIVAVTLHPGTKGDASTVYETMLDTCKNLVDLGKEDMPKFVADKGYHSNETMKFKEEAGLDSYFTEPNRGKRNWEGKEVEKRGTLACRASAGHGRVMGSSTMQARRSIDKPELNKQIQRRFGLPNCSVFEG
jgi:transposase